MKLHPLQLELLLAKERWLGYFAGRRFGKTEAIKNDIKHKLTLRAGFEYCYITPKYSQSFDVFTALDRDPDLLRWGAKLRWQPYPHIVLGANQSRVSFRSFERPLAIKSGGMDRITFDEIQDIGGGEKFFWPVLRPMLSDRNGSLIVSGQLLNKEDFAYRTFYLPGQKTLDGRPNPKHDPDYRSWKIPTRLGIKFQTAEGRKDLAAALAQIGKRDFAIQYDCEPLGAEECMFLPEDITLCKRGEVLAKGRPNRTYILSADLGASVTPSAYVVYEKETKTVVHAEKRPLREKHLVGAKRLSDLKRLFNDARTYVDATGGATGGHLPPDDILKVYRKEIPDMHEYIWSGRSKPRVFQSLGLAIENHVISIPENLSELHSELATFISEYEGGFYTYHADKGKKDDLVLALGCAWDVAEHRGQSGQSMLIRA